MTSTVRIDRRMRRKRGLRERIRGTPDRPRITVFRSLKQIYAQVVDDLAGRTVASASTRDVELPTKSGGNIEAAKAVGRIVAERAIKAGVTKVVFDRNGYRYHGRIKALADAAREGGLRF